MGYTRLSDYDDVTADEKIDEGAISKPRQRYALHAFLFLATFCSCIIAGLAWRGDPNMFDISRWGDGLTYAVLIMLFISAHEFGHFFAAKYHGVDATLPYYIPMPFFTIMPFGTMGAVIRTRSPIMSRKVLFDIGVSGPLAGFVVCVVILIVGLATLPSKDYLYTIHPEYLTMFGGQIPEFGLRFGDTILFHALARVFANPNGFLPPMNEIYHYPYLCVGWFGMFVTSLNLLPVGQLDGGHVSYAMFGAKQGIVSRVVVSLLVLVGLFGVLGQLRGLLQTDSPDALFMTVQSIIAPPLNWISHNIPWAFDGWVGWLMWAGLARFFFRLDHPPIEDEQPLDSRRMVVGWLAIAIFILTISLNGIMDSPVDLTPGGTIPNKTIVLSPNNGLEIPGAHS